MRILVTGAAGFVGGHLLRELDAAGARTWAGSLDGLPPSEGAPAGTEWVALDVTSDESLRAAVERARPDGVVHLAAQSSVGASFGDPAGTWEVNATGTLRLLQAVSPSTRLLLVSSAEVYGAVPEEEQPIAEDRPLRPASPYAASKAAAEMATVQAALAGGARAVVARSFNHTGPGQDARFALPSFAAQLAAIADGAAAPVLRVGNLEARRDFLDVRDVVRAYRVLLERGEPGRAYNVCSGRAWSLCELVERLVALSGTETRVEVDPERVRPVDIPLLVGDAGRLRALGWEPEIPLEKTLRDLLEHARARAAA